MCGAAMEQSQRAGNKKTDRSFIMTKRRIVYTIIAAMALSAVIIIISLAASIKDQRAEALRKSLENSVIETQAEIGFTLKEYEGEIAVFREGSSTPYKRLGVSTALMTDYDRSQLKAGIYVRTEKELRALIEDFTS